jgi:hypothetical protein
MGKKVLLAGLLPDRVDDFRRQLGVPDVEFTGVTKADEVREVFARADFEHVFLGGGMDLSTRLEMVRAVFESSDRATVHMKDHWSGPEGFVPFVQAVLGGLDDYAPRKSARAILRTAQPSGAAEG